ncbi:MAG: HAMP domain-containing protein, partial [Aquabacterium sp.]|nr:HAMP domain-containing protein [Aquabacterium sp.]
MNLSQRLWLPAAVSTLLATLAAGLLLAGPAVAPSAQMVWTVAGLLGLLVATTLVSTALQVGQICQPLNELSDLARRIGDGDLDVSVATNRKDEIGSVQQSLATMRDALRGIVGQVRQSAESIQVASTEVASGNADLSHRTEQTASNLQQTASSLQQLTANVRQSADAAAQANQLAASASQVATRGGEVVAQVVTTMDEINTSSKR